MCLWRGRCIYEEEDVFIKEKNIYEGRKKNPGIFEEIKNKIFFKNQSNSWIFFYRKSKQIPRIFERKNQNVTYESPFLQKFLDFLKLLQLRVSTTQKGNEDVLAADSLQMQ